LAERGLVSSADAEGVHAVGLGVGLLRRLDQSSMDVAASIGVTSEAVDGLKFSAALPERLAMKTLAERTYDVASAASVVQDRVTVRTDAPGLESYAPAVVAGGDQAGGDE
jgi:hypothetical protein